MKLGGWDTFVSYYLTDCDMHERFAMSGIRMPVAEAGRIADVGGSIDLNLLFRRKIDPSNPPRTAGDLEKLPEDDRGGQGFQEIVDAIKVQEEAKAHGEEERNSWQYKQTGGQGEPFYRDPQGFEKGLQMAIACGVEVRILLSLSSSQLHNHVHILVSQRSHANSEIMNRHTTRSGDTGIVIYERRD